MSIKEISQDSYVSGKKLVKVISGGKAVTLYANQLGYMAVQSVYARAQINGEEGLVHLVAQSISDEEGIRFTYQEVLSLKKEVAEPLFQAVMEVNGLTGEEKK